MFLVLLLTAFNFQPCREQMRACGKEESTPRKTIKRGMGQGDSEGPGRRAKATARDLEDPAMKKMFVGNLHTSTTVDNLQEYFGKFGDIEKCYAATHQDSGKCKGYGFVTFKTAGGVDRVQEHRPHELHNRTMDTKRAVPKEWMGQPEAEVRSKKIYIAGLHGPKSGLHEGISDEDLRQFFGQYGEVTNVDQKSDKNTKKKTGYGYIEFSDTDPVDKLVLVGVVEVGEAVLEVKKGLSREQQEEVRMKKEEGKGAGGWGQQGMWDMQMGHSGMAQPPLPPHPYPYGHQSGMNQGRGVKRVAGREQGEWQEQGKRPKASVRDPEDPAMRKLFLGNLHTSTTLEALKEYFAKFGEIERCYCATHKDSDKCRGYGFVTYKKSVAVDDVQENRPHRLLDRVVDTKRAVPKEWMGQPEAEVRSKKIYIAGLHGPKSGLKEGISDTDLRQFFDQFGEVVNVDQKLDKTTKKKTGYGYIEFSDLDPVDKLVLVGVVEVGGAVLEVKRGLSREQQEEVRRKKEEMGAGGAPGGVPGAGGWGAQGAGGWGAQGAGGWGAPGAGGWGAPGAGGQAVSGAGQGMQGMMRDVQSKMAGMGHSGMAEQFEQLNSMMGKGEMSTEMIQSMEGTLRSMQGAMQGGEGGGLVASMGSMMSMMINMMTMCQKTMASAAKKSQPADNGSHGGSQGYGGEWGGGYGAKTGYAGAGSYDTSGKDWSYGAGASGYGGAGSYGFGEGGKWGPVGSQGAPAFKGAKDY